MLMSLVLSLSHKCEPGLIPQSSVVLRVGNAKYINR